MPRTRCKNGITKSPTNARPTKSWFKLPDKSDTFGQRLFFRLGYLVTFTGTTLLVFLFERFILFAVNTYCPRKSLLLFFHHLGLMDIFHSLNSFPVAAQLPASSQCPMLTGITQSNELSLRAWHQQRILKDSNSHVHPSVFSERAQPPFVRLNQLKLNFFFLDIQHSRHAAAVQFDGITTIKWYYPLLLCTAKNCSIELLMSPIWAACAPAKSAEYLLHCRPIKILSSSSMRGAMAHHASGLLRSKFFISCGQCYIAEELFRKEGSQSGSEVLSTGCLCIDSWSPVNATQPLGQASNASQSWGRSRPLYQF